MAMRRVEATELAGESMVKSQSDCQQSASPKSLIIKVALSSRG